MEAINQPGVNRGSPVRADDPRYLHPPRHQGVFSLALRGFFTLHTYSVVTSSHSLRLYLVPVDRHMYSVYVCISGLRYALRGCP